MDQLDKKNINIFFLNKIFGNLLENFTEFFTVQVSKSSAESHRRKCDCGDSLGAETMRQLHSVEESINLCIIELLNKMQKARQLKVALCISIKARLIADVRGRVCNRGMSWS